MTTTRFKASEDIIVRSNLILTGRERGKIVCRRKGHNIWVNLGRAYLASLVGYASYVGEVGVPERDDRIRYIGLGVGGNRQIALGVANASPVGGSTGVHDYAGSNALTDTDPTQTVLERPVRVSWAGGSPTAPPYDPIGDEWYGQVAPIAGLSGHPTAYETRFTHLFSETDLNGTSSYYPALPLSEVGLFPGAINRHRPSSVDNPSNAYVAYDTFDTITKTVAIEFQVDWTIRF